MNNIPRWRIAAAVVVLGVLVFLIGEFAPIYFHNMQLQNFVADLAARPDTAAKSDDLVRTWVIDKASQLDLPVRSDNVTIVHAPEGIRIDVRYFVRVNLPLYTVDLHFYPGAGSR